MPQVLFFILLGGYDSEMGADSAVFRKSFIVNLTTRTVISSCLCRRDMASSVKAVAAAAAYE